MMRYSPIQRLHQRTAAGDAEKSGCANEETRRGCAEGKSSNHACPRETHSLASGR